MIDRPLRAPTIARSLTNVAGRTRSVERRFRPTAEASTTPPLPFISIEKDFTSMALPANTPLDLDFTGTPCTTNDPGASGTTSPFTGDFFSFDWSGDAYHLVIEADGIYLVYRYWSMISYDRSSLFSPPLIGMNFESPWPSTAHGRGWAMSNNANAGKMVSQPLITGDPDVEPTVEDTSLLIVSGSAALRVSISHYGLEGNLDEAAAGMGALRLGSYSA